MDIRIEKKKGIRALFTRRGLPYLAGALLLVFVVWLLLRDDSSTLRIDARTISVGEVVRGEFNDYIRVTGQVQPITTVQLSPLEAGVVERLVVEEGTTVRKGDVLVVLSNTSLTLEILNSEAELAEKQNILRNTLISMEQEKLDLRLDKVQLDLDVERKRRTWRQNEELYRNDLIAREELTAAGLDQEIWQCPVVLLADVRSVGVQGDGRTYGHPIVLRPVSSEDAMTADWTRLPYDVLARISTRITNSVPEVNRVVLDVTSKPPATIEWE